jgi:glycosyltransferase involved in cell wall biosynthesis
MALRFALVTTCKNEAQSFPTWKQDILNQSLQPDEICVVDAESTDGTLEMLYRWSENDPRVKILVQKCNPSRGRNLAVQMTNCDYFASTDMGCRIDKDWFKNICFPFKTDISIDAVVGNFEIDYRNSKSPATKAEYYYTGYRRRKFEGSRPFNRSVAFKKSAWILLGELPEDLTFAGDDTVLGLQILYKSKLRLEYAENAKVYWNRFSYLADFWKEQYRYGLGNGEANIFSPTILNRVDLKRMSILLLWVECLGIMAKRSIKPIIRSLIHGELLPALYIPLLIFGNELSYTKGFIKGYQRGEKECKSTRNRLSNIPLRDLLNYS